MAFETRKRKPARQVEYLRTKTIIVPPKKNNDPPNRTGVWVLVNGIDFTIISREEYEEQTEEE